MLTRRPKPVRGDLDEAALRLLARHGAQVLATARRYAATPEDAEDAYQRGLEILLTKAPTANEDELVPWLKTVVKHEAFALRRQRDRHSPVTDDGELFERGNGTGNTHDQAERLERLHQGAEALRQLKPQEVRCLVLKAQGLSYREICQVTGFSYTKVNRCLTEGRQALTVRLAGIHGGIECAKLAPVLSALADGEASAEDLARLRPHMKTCLSCRARLREFRAAPARVAALLPPAALVGGDGGEGLRGSVEAVLGGLQQKLEALLGASQQKAAAFGERAHTAAELATGQKLAAVAASAAALAGGGTAVDQFTNHREPPQPPAAQQVERPAAGEQSPADAPPPAPAPPSQVQPPAGAPALAAPPPPASQPPPAPPPPDPANEFAPPATPPPARASAEPAHAPRPSSSTRAGAGSRGAAQEFAP